MWNTTNTLAQVISFLIKNKQKKRKSNLPFFLFEKSVTPPPKPAPEVPSAPPIVSNYTQPVPKPETSTQTNGYLAAASSYNPLSVKQNNQNTQSNGMDSIYNKTVTYDAVPTQKTQHGSYKAPAQKSHSYTEPKAKANQHSS